MNCVACQHWLPKQSGEMAKHGYAICDKSGTAYKFLSANHPACPKLEPVPTKVLADRQNWLSKMDKRQTKATVLPAPIKPRHGSKNILAEGLQC